MRLLAGEDAAQEGFRLVERAYGLQDDRGVVDDVGVASPALNRATGEPGRLLGDDVVAAGGLQQRERQEVHGARIGRSVREAAAVDRDRLGRAAGAVGGDRTLEGAAGRRDLGPAIGHALGERGGGGLDHGTPVATAA